MSWGAGGASVISVEQPAASRDAFGRLRVSNPTTLADSTMQYDIGAIYWQNVITGSATAAHNANASCVDLTVTANAADRVIRQTREYLRYQPGKSQLFKSTFVFGAAVSGVVKRVGYYDNDNGVFFEQAADGTYNFVIRSRVTGSVVENRVPQSAWDDPFDGSGASGFTGDPTKAQILVIDLQWLSVGTVRCGFEHNGTLNYAHSFHHSNILSVPYMSTANLPCRYEIDTDGTNGDTFITICTAVESEGGFETSRGNLFEAGNGVTTISVTTRRPLMSIRPKATFNSIVNRGLILPVHAGFFTQDKQVLFEVVYGGTLTGSSFASVNAESIAEVDVSATAITGGIVQGMVSTDRRADSAVDTSSRYPLFLDYAGAHPTSPFTDCLTIVATTLQTATSCTSTLAWKEIR